MNDSRTARNVSDALDSDAVRLERTGKDGTLTLVFQNDSTGRTIIKSQFARTPLHVQRALHYDDLCPDLAYLYIVSASGGILQEDRYEIDITMKKDSKAHITTQGATRIYSMNTGCAIQTINVTLEENAYMEFIPDQIIPYGGSRFYQDAHLNVHDSATLVYSDIVTPGRVAMKELFEYDLCHIKTRVVNQKDRLKLTDVARLDPKKQRLASFGILGDSTVVGSVYIITEKNVPVLCKEISEMISGMYGILGGASMIKDDGGVIVRILGCHTEHVKNAILDIARHAREKCTGFSSSEIRKS